MTDSKDLTVKQKAFVKRYVETGNGTLAALEAYNTNSKGVAAAISSENLRKPNIQKSLRELMQEKGLGDDNLLNIHQELLNDPNPVVRLKALDMAYELNGTYKTDSASGNSNTPTTVEQYDPDQLKQELKLIVKYSGMTKEDFGF